MSDDNTATAAPQSGAAAGDASAVGGLSPIAKDADKTAADPAVEKAAAPAAGADGKAAPAAAGAAPAAAPGSTAKPAAAPNDGLPSPDDPAQSFAPFLEEKAQKAAREEKWRDALNAREHVLRCYLRAFGEQSNEANLQKQLLSALILKAGDFNAKEGGGGGGDVNASMRSDSSMSRPGTASPSASRSRTMNTSAAAASSSDPLSQDRPRNLLSNMFGSPVGDLTMSSRLEYAQMLLSPASIGPVLSEEPNLRHLRARLLLAHSTITAKMQRPRSAIPMLTEAMRILQGLIQSAQAADDYDPDSTAASEPPPATLSPANQEAARLELCESYLTKSVLLSNCQKHEDALATSMWGLAQILALEEESWRNFQDLRGGDPNAPRAKIFHASLQAACHHNMGAEQEHLGLTELALDSYETGFELAVSVFGIAHPMSERLKMCYSDLFSALHYKHFVRNGEQRDVAKQALKDSEIAITHLRASYYASERHRAALTDQTKKQTKILARQGTDASLLPPGAPAMSTSRSTSRNRSRPTSSKKKRPASRPATGQR